MLPRIVIGVVATVASFLGAPVANADNGQLYECPGTHAHVWDKDQCTDIQTPFGFPGSGHGGNGGGLLGLVHSLTGGLL